MEVLSGIWCFSLFLGYVKSKFQVVIRYFGAVEIYAPSIGYSIFKVVGLGNVMETNCSCTSIIVSRIFSEIKFKKKIVLLTFVFIWDLKSIWIHIGSEQLCSSQCTGTICNFFTSTKTTCVVAGLQIGLWPGSCFQPVFDPKESKRKSSRPFSFVHPYPVHWIWGHQITQFQIKSEKFENFDWISEFGKRQ